MHPYSGLRAARMCHRRQDHDITAGLATAVATVGRARVCLRSGRPSSAAGAHRRGCLTTLYNRTLSFQRIQARYIIYHGRTALSSLYTGPVLNSRLSASPHRCWPGQNTRAPRPSVGLRRRASTNHHSSG